MYFRWEWVTILIISHLMKRNRKENLCDVIFGLLYTFALKMFGFTYDVILKN